MSGQSSLSTLTELESSPSELSEKAEMSNDEDEDEDEGFDSSFDDDSSSLMSLSARADHDLKYRARDEKRLILDLSKHKQMLIDSQKLSQSIMRCLRWSEEMISEGNKALEYHVKVSDVEIGGRVLTQDDEADEAESRKGLLSPSATMSMLDEANLWANGLHQLERPEDQTLPSSFEEAAGVR